MSDAEEFWEEAKNYKKSEETSLMQESPPSMSKSMSETDKNGVPVGKLIQYAYNGEGFSPTSSTVQSIPSSVYSIDVINEMITFVPRKISTDRLLRLPDSKSDEVIQRIQKFWTLKKAFKYGNDFASGGYLHKMGIMLFGPPGSGKTCTAKFIINDVIEKGGVVILGNGHPTTVKSGLQAFRSIEPERPVVVLFEDFDELIQKYSESEYLAILDGDSSIDNALFLATTNYPSRLDPRMYNRPGRFSDVIKIGMPNSAARRIYLDSQIKNKEEIDKIVSITDGFSIDHLKAVILGVYFEGRPLESEVKRLRTLFRAPKDDQGTESSMGIVD